jgi:type IV secretion system protein VirB10
MSDEAAPTPEEAVKLRGDPPRVMRLSRKAIGIASACGFALVGGALIYALQPASQAEREELLNTEGTARPDALADGPRDYGDVPKLGPPLPGDLGAPILAAQQRGDVAELPPIGATPPTGPAPTPAQTAAEAERQRLVQERSAARESRLFFGGGAGAAALGDGSQVADASGGPPAPQLAAETQRPAFADRPVERRTVSESRIEPPAGTHVLQAGSIIPAALITGIRSDLPGQVTAQVTEPVYDSVTGRILLIPQGSRLIGDYNADVSFGQRRVQLAWNRLILPDGRSIVLERQPGGDPSGFAGLQDGVDFHWGGVLRAALVSTLLGVGGELGAGNDDNLTRALRRGSQDSIGRAGEQVVSRELDVRPTLTIRPGFPVRVLVTRDLILRGGS